jgi:hypothetical protein
MFGSVDPNGLAKAATPTLSLSDLHLETSGNVHGPAGYDTPFRNGHLMSSNAATGWQARRAFVALFVTLVAIGVADEARACQCGRERTVEEARAAATYVVTGIVRGVRPSFIRGSRFRYSDGFVPPPVWPTTSIDIQVTRSFGHAAPDRIELTHIGCCVCEAELEQGREYLLFVLPSWDVRDAYEVSRCYPNRKVAAAAAMFRQLPSPTIHHGSPSASILTRLRWAAAEPVGLAGAKYRNSGFWSYRQPLTSIIDSPLLPFSSWALGGVVTCILVVGIRRRARTRNHR